MLLGAGPVVLVEVGTGPRADRSPGGYPRRHAAVRLGIGRDLSVSRPFPPIRTSRIARRSGGARRTPERAGRVAWATTHVVSHACGVPRASRRGRRSRGRVQPCAELKI